MRESTGKAAKLGATPAEGSQCEFLVWAPLAESVSVHVVSPEAGVLPLGKLERGYHYGLLDGIGPGSLYFYSLDGLRRRPDPASRFQPEGVHGPSSVVDRGFSWDDGSWSGTDLRNYVIYELHVGTFTPEGTFDAVIDRLDRLSELGITAVEIMPVAQFPGDRNWGYDGAYPFAAQNSYGGPEGLKRLVNACHLKGLAVVLDVVYNHLGPEGNYLAEFGPYFTDRYRTPWGTAINFDGPESDEVRRYFIENALYWVGECHIDALRLDAVHAIMDQSPRPFIQELAEAVHEKAAKLNRPLYLMAENDLNDARIVRPRDLGGYGLDAHWNDDFHHALHTVLTGEQTGYYRDFGQFSQLARSYREGFVYSGQYSIYRRRSQGSSTRDIPPHRLVAFSQNHDQIGNRMFGERLTRLVSFESLKLAAGSVLLSPFTPLIFMGEEYGETAPFQYFVSHSDPDLIEAVQKGRQEEFAEFRWSGKPPDPQAVETFRRSKLQENLRLKGEHEVLWRFYRELLRLRREFIASARTVEVLSYYEGKLVLIQLRSNARTAVVLFHFDRMGHNVTLPWPSGTWLKEMDSAEKRWCGNGSRVPPLIEGRESVSLGIQAYSFAFFLGQDT